MALVYFLIETYQLCCSKVLLETGKVDLVLGYLNIAILACEWPQLSIEETSNMLINLIK